MNFKKNKNYTMNDHTQSVMGTSKSTLFFLNVNFNYFFWSIAQLFDVVTDLSSETLEKESPTCGKSILSKLMKYYMLH